MAGRVGILIVNSPVDMTERNTGGFTRGASGLRLFRDVFGTGTKTGTQLVYVV